MTDDQPIPPTPESNGNAKNDAANPHSNAVPEVKIPPSHACYRITCDKKRDKWDIAKLVAEFVGLGFLILYTIYTAGIYCANQKAADAAAKAATIAEDTLRMGYRPWVNAETANLVQPIVFPPEERFYLKLSFALKNTGTSVATDGVAIAEAVPDEVNAMLKHSDNICTKLEQAKVPVEKNMRPRATGFVLAPGNTLPHSIGMGSDEISSQQVVNGKFFVLGCVIYRDQFKTWHHTKFCFQPTDRITNPQSIPFTICDFDAEAD